MALDKGFRTINPPLVKATELPLYKSPRHRGECRDATGYWNQDTKTLTLEGVADVSQTPEVLRFIADKPMGAPVGPIFRGENVYWILSQDTGGPFDEKARPILIRKDQLVW